MNKVVTLGELILRLSPPQYERFEQASRFDIDYGGAEANVALSLANYGFKSYFVSKLPDNDIGQAGINHLKKSGVNTQYITRGGKRMGLYYLETGSSMRPAKVIYDRSHSSIAETSLADFNFDQIFQDTSWFHFSGILPALGEKARLLTLAALKSATKNGVTVSLDFNFRRNLWTLAQAQEVMKPLMKYVDVCFDAHENLLVDLSQGDFLYRQLGPTDFQDIFKRMIDEFDLKYVVNSIRRPHSASDHTFSACGYDGRVFHQSKEYDLRIVDRVGGGDSYVAGVIAGLLDGKNLGDAIDFGLAASSLKHTIHGDFNLVSRGEVATLLAGNRLGKVYI